MSTNLPFRPVFALLSLLGVLALGPTLAVASEGDLATRWPVNEEDPMQGIPSEEERNADPLEFGYFVQDLIARAEEAFRGGDWQTAIKYYQPLAIAIPDRAVAHSKLCEAYAKSGQWHSATVTCRQAMGLKGSRVLDHLFFLDAILREKVLGPAHVAEVDASLEHLRKYARMHPQRMPGPEHWRGAVAPADRNGDPQSSAEPAEEPAEGTTLGKQELARRRTQQAKTVLFGHKATLSPEEQAREILAAKKDDAEPIQQVSDMHLPTQIELFNCKLGARIGDTERLQQCIGRLRGYNLPALVLLPFEWAQALAAKDQARADALLDRAERDGVAQGAIDMMRQEQKKRFGVDWLHRPWALMGALALALVLALVFGQRLRARHTASAS